MIIMTKKKEKKEKKPEILSDRLEPVNADTRHTKNGHMVDSKGEVIPAEDFEKWAEGALDRMAEDKKEGEL